MQQLTLSIPVDAFVPGDGFHVFANVDAVGKALDAIDYNRPITGETPLPFWPLVPVQPGHLEGRHLAGYHLGQPASEAVPDQVIETPLLFFGWYLFALKTFDAAGNASSGEPQTRRAFVNSGPEPPRRFRLSTTQEGRPVFGFSPPAQLRD